MSLSRSEAGYGTAQTQPQDRMSTIETVANNSQYPHWTGRRTKQGLPICVFDIAYLDSDALSTYGKDRNTSNATRQAILFHDYLTRFVFPLCSVVCDRPSPNPPVTSAVYLADISKLTFKQAWNVRSYAQDTSKLLATCYPEVIDRVYVSLVPIGDVLGICCILETGTNGKTRSSTPHLTSEKYGPS